MPSQHGERLLSVELAPHTHYRQLRSSRARHQPRSSRALDTYRIDMPCYSCASRFSARISTADFLIRKRSPDSPGPAQQTGGTEPDFAPELSPHLLQRAEQRAALGSQGLSIPWRCWCCRCRSGSAGALARRSSKPVGGICTSPLAAVCVPRVLGGSISPRDRLSPPSRAGARPWRSSPPSRSSACSAGAMLVQTACAVTRMWARRRRSWRSAPTALLELEQLLHLTLRSALTRPRRAPCWDVPCHRHLRASDWPPDRPRRGPATAIRCRLHLRSFEPIEVARASESNVSSTCCRGIVAGVAVCRSSSRRESGGPEKQTRILRAAKSRRSTVRHRIAELLTTTVCLHAADHICMSEHQKDNIHTTALSARTGVLRASHVYRLKADVITTTVREQRYGHAHANFKKAQNTAELRADENLTESRRSSRRSTKSLSMSTVQAMNFPTADCEIFTAMSISSDATFSNLKDAYSKLPAEVRKALRASGSSTEPNNLIRLLKEFLLDPDIQGRWNLTPPSPKNA